MDSHGGRLIVVTGKGGVGKTTISAAIGLTAAEAGLRTLIVETASDSRLLSLFGLREGASGSEREISPGLQSIRLTPRQLVEDYFTSLLRFSFLSRRLFESSSFNALTAAAPGISEFLLLERVLEWLAPGQRRRQFDVVILDGPATGHAIKLLRAPKNIHTMVPAGPLAGSTSRMMELLSNPRHAEVVIVGIPEELSVQETIETYRTLGEEVGVPIARPVVNRMFPQRFQRAEIEQIEAADASLPAIAAARFAIARRHQAERNCARLKRALGVTPLQLPQVFSARIEIEQLRQVGLRLNEELHLSAPSRRRSRTG